MINSILSGTLRSQVRHFVALSFLSACTASLPGPTVGAAPAASFVEIPFAPPPARVEVVPAQPSSDDIWIDGEWIWQNGRWAWRSGYWVIPPTKAVYSLSTLRHTKDGTLLLARGTWWNPSGQELQIVGNESGQAREGPVVTPQGQLEEAAPNIEKATHERK